ncbi:hypothetical protein BCR42DRAFT_492771 [Absidia repens]|uniref:Pleckstrin homology domain-containing protein n=1 Tax=Absidia repens TaxID=90262 RepID=A0A1X2ID30_9FUNG|nr:hypothetical protein BCR42DRAFT_492771 [Absidia repens]
MIHSDRLQGNSEDDSVSQTFNGDDPVSQSLPNGTAAGTIRHSQMVFATDIAQGLISEVRKLQQTIQEKDRLIKDLEINKADGENDKELTQKQLRQKDALEEKLKEDNWNLEVANQDLQTDLSELNKSITKLNADHSKALKQLRASLEQIEIYKAQQEKTTSTIDVLKARHDHEQQLLRRNTGNLQRDVVQLKKRLDEVNTELRICKSKAGDQTLGMADDDDLAGLTASSPGTNNLSSLNFANSQQRALEVETLKQSLGHAHRMISSLRNNLQKEKVERIDLKKTLAETQESLEKLQKDDVESGGNSSLKKSSVASRTKVVRKRGGMPRRGSPAIIETPATYMGNDQLGSLALDTTLNVKNHAMGNSDAEFVDNDTSMDDISSVDQADGGFDDDDDDDDDCHRLDLSPIQQGQSLDMELQLGGFTPSLEPLPSAQEQTVAERQYFDKGVNTYDDLWKSAATERQVPPHVNNPINSINTNIDNDNEKDATNIIDGTPISIDSSFQATLVPAMHLDQQSQPLSTYHRLDMEHSPIPSDIAPRHLQQTNLSLQSQSPDVHDDQLMTYREGTLTPLPSSPLHIQQHPQSTLSSVSSPIILNDQLDVEPCKSTPITHTSAAAETNDDHYIVNTKHTLDDLSATTNGDNQDISTSKTNQYENQQKSVSPPQQPHHQSEPYSIPPVPEKITLSHPSTEYQSKGTGHDLETVHSLSLEDARNQAVEMETKDSTDDSTSIKHVVSSDKNCGENFAGDVSSPSILIGDIPKSMIGASGILGTLSVVESALQYDMEFKMAKEEDVDYSNGDISTMNTSKMISRDEADALVKAGIADALAKERLEAATRRSELDINFVTRSEAEAMARAQTDQVLKKERDRTSTMLTKAQADTLAKKYAEQVLLEEDNRNKQQNQELNPKLPPTPATSSLLAKAKMAPSLHSNTQSTSDATVTLFRQTSHASIAPTPKPSTSTSSTTTSASSSSRLGLFSGFRKLQPSVSTPAKSERLRPSASTSSLRRTTTATSNSSHHAHHTSGLPHHSNHHQRQQHEGMKQHLQPPSSHDASYGTVRITETSTYSRKPSIASFNQHQQRLKQPSMQSLSPSEKGSSRGVAPSVFSMGDLSKQSDSGELISAITQTMIGEWMWKHTRNHMGGGISVNKHKRFFWVHPYTRTLYWSTNEPGIDADEAKAKSAFIESISSIPSNDTVDASPLSLLIKTAKRDLKLTAPTLERHELWRMSLSYLLVPPGEESEMGDVIQVDPYHDSDAATISTTTHTLPTATMINAPMTESTNASDDDDDEDTMAPITTTSPNSHQAGHGKNEFSAGASDNDDTDSSMDPVINVRQCCDDHDVATLSQH